MNRAYKNQPRRAGFLLVSDQGLTAKGTIRNTLASSSPHQEATLPGESAAERANSRLGGPCRAGRTQDVRSVLGVGGLGTCKGARSRSPQGQGPPRGVLVLLCRHVPSVKEPSAPRTSSWPRGRPALPQRPHHQQAPPPPQSVGCRPSPLLPSLWDDAPRAARRCCLMLHGARPRGALGTVRELHQAAVPQCWPRARGHQANNMH